MQVVNQIEAHPLLQQPELDAFCKEHNIHITAYSPLGHGLEDRKMLTDYTEVKEIAQKLNAEPAQVLIAYGVYRGYSVVPKSVNESTYFVVPRASTQLSSYCSVS